MASTKVGTTKSVRHAKLRTSCDACLTAKVKCIKTTAKCRRCTAQRLTCRFSPSQRAGKPPKRKEGSIVGTSSTARPRGDGRGDSAGEEGANYDPVPGPTIRTDAADASSSERMTNFTDDNLYDHTWIPALDQDTVLGDHTVGQYGNVDSVASLFADIPDWNFPFPETIPALSQYVDQVAHAAPADSLLQPVDLSGGLTVTTSSRKVSVFSDATTVQNENSSPESLNGAVKTGDISLLAFETLSMISQPGALVDGQIQGPAPTASGAVSTDSLQPSLLLAHTAISNIKEILQGPSPVKEDSAILCATVVAKVLGFYQSNLTASGVGTMMASKSTKSKQEVVGSFGPRWETDAISLKRHLSLVVEMHDIASLTTILETRPANDAESDLVRDQLAILNQSLKQRLSSAFSKIALLTQSLASNYT